MRVRWSPLATDRVAEIARFIARDKPEAARRWVERVFAAAERLAFLPRSGRIVPEMADGDVREVLLGEYRIIYQVRRSAVEVLTVRHARQQFNRDEIIRPPQRR